MRFVAHAVMLVALSMSMPANGEQSPDHPSRGNWDFSPEKAWEIDRVGDQPLARPAELRVSPGGSFYFHDFDRHISEIEEATQKADITTRPVGWGMLRVRG